MIYDALYRVTPKDLQGQLLEWNRYNDIQAAAAVNVPASIDPGLNRDQVLLLKHLSLYVSPGAAQWHRGGHVAVTGSAAVPNILLSVPGDSSGGVAAVFESGLSLVTDYLIFPGDTLVAVTTFNAGAAANNVTLSAAGWVLPRGNINY